MRKSSLKDVVRSPLIDNPLTRNLVLLPLFWYGVRTQRNSGRTPWASYFAFRQLYSQTKGEFTRRKALELRKPPVQLKSAEGVLGQGQAWSQELGAAVEGLRRDGYYIFSTRLPDEDCRQLQEFTRGLPARLTPPRPNGQQHVTFDPDKPLAARYDFEEAQYLGHPVIQKLMCDESMMAVAQGYLEAAPINDLSAMWWSAPFGNASSAAAQLFHFDLDRLQFLKIFFYLTDVGPDNGPHMYVRGSHRKRPEVFFEDRRFPDSEVAGGFPAEDIREVHGPMGTIIAGDTTCLHKGKSLRAGSRLMFEIEFTVSLFGQAYETLNVPREMTVLRQRIADYPAIFERFHAG
jgi:hypothetical protein